MLGHHFSWAFRAHIVFFFVLKNTIIAAKMNDLITPYSCPPWLKKNKLFLGNKRIRRFLVRNWLLRENKPPSSITELVSQFVYDGVLVNCWAVLILTHRWHSIMECWRLPELVHLPTLFSFNEILLFFYSIIINNKKLDAFSYVLLQYHNLYFIFLTKTVS